MEQGMWHTDLQSAEVTICTGWLLYLVEEYDREALCTKIWNLTGMQIALHFQAIDDSTKKDP